MLTSIALKELSGWASNISVSASRKNSIKC